VLNRLLTQTGVLEREHFTPAEASALERLASRLAAVERYRIVRKYVSGVVIDAACGCGYGSAMLSRCPAAVRVLGIDRDSDSIAFARSEYSSDAVTFSRCDFETPDFAALLAAEQPDCVVSVETLEHLRDPAPFVAAVKASGAGRFVATFPSFATSSFNQYHLNDITLDGLTALVGHGPVKALVIDDAVTLAVYDL
jgi:hypothetical protein